MSQTYELTVKGRVQGVGFRAFTCNVGESFGLYGSVWNNRNGTVSVLVVVENDSDLDRFSKALRDGPGHVTDIVEEKSSATPVGPGFRIEQTR